jgi:hypothetical protein
MWRWAAAKSPSPPCGSLGERLRYKDDSDRPLPRSLGRGAMVLKVRRSPQLFIYSDRTEYSETGLPFVTDSDRPGSRAREPLGSHHFRTAFVVEWILILDQCNNCLILLLTSSHSKRCHGIEKYLACAAHPLIGVWEGALAQRRTRTAKHLECDFSNRARNRCVVRMRLDLLYALSPQAKFCWHLSYHPTLIAPIPGHIEEPNPVS